MVTLRRRLQLPVGSGSTYHTKSEHNFIGFGPTVKHDFIGFGITVKHDFIGFGPNVKHDFTGFGSPIKHEPTFDMKVKKEQQIIVEEPTYSIPWVPVNVSVYSESTGVDSGTIDPKTTYSKTNSVSHKRKRTERYMSLKRLRFNQDYEFVI